jgi:hypothetical protein
VTLTANYYIALVLCYHRQGNQDPEMSVVGIAIILALWRLRVEAEGSRVPGKLGLHTCHKQTNKQTPKKNDSQVFLTR